MEETFDFSEALKALKEGKKVTRRGWNGNKVFSTPMHLELQRPDEHSKMKRPYIFIHPSADYVVPWVASNADLLGEDWAIIG